MLVQVILDRQIKILLVLQGNYSNNSCIFNVEYSYHNIIFIICQTLTYINMTDKFPQTPHNQQTANIMNLTESDPDNSPQAIIPSDNEQ